MFMRASQNNAVSITARRELLSRCNARLEMVGIFLDKDSRGTGGRQASTAELQTKFRLFEVNLFLDISESLVSEKQLWLQFRCARQSKMESVSSCSPAAASTSSTPASGATKPKLPSHPALPPKTGAGTLSSLHNARGSLATQSMPHSRDERRDDTALIQHNADKARWLPQAHGTALPSMGSHFHDRSPYVNPYFYPRSGKAPAPWLHQQAHEHWPTHGEAQIVARDPSFARRLSNRTSRSPNEFHRMPLPTQHSGVYFPQAAYTVYKPNAGFKTDQQRPTSRLARDTHSTSDVSYYRSTVVIPQNISIPKDLSASSEENASPAEESLGKRSSVSSNQSETSPGMKRSKIDQQSRGGFDKLDLLCSATLELGPLQENPSGCSCPKSKCIALYCDCFKAGRRCDATMCTCLNCKNTIAESGASGARSKVSSTLAIGI